MIFSYLHPIQTFPLIFHLAVLQMIKLFLVQIINNDVNCIVSSNDNVLE